MWQADPVLRTESSTPVTSPCGTSCDQTAGGRTNMPRDSARRFAKMGP